MSDIKIILRLMLVLLLATSNSVMADPPVYENFKGKVLNSGRWLGGRVDTGVVEIRRKIQKGAIRMRIRGVASDQVTSGGRERVLNRIWVHKDRAPSIRSFQTYVQVNQAEIQDCDDETLVNSRSAYQSHNVWFNNGESTGTENRQGDVYTQFGLTKSIHEEVSEDQLEVIAYVGRCADPDCASSVELLEEVIDVYPIGSRVALRTTWDDARKEIRFYSRQKGQTPVSYTFDYAAVVSDGGNKGTINKRFP